MGLFWRIGAPLPRSICVRIFLVSMPVSSLALKMPRVSIRPPLRPPSQDCHRKSVFPGENLRVVMDGDQRKIAGRLKTIYLSVVSHRLSFCEIPTPYELDTDWNERIGHHYQTVDLL